MNADFVTGYILHVWLTIGNRNQIWTKETETCWAKIIQTDTTYVSILKEHMSQFDLEKN